MREEVGGGGGGGNGFGVEVGVLTTGCACRGVCSSHDCLPFVSMMSLLDWVVDDAIKRGVGVGMAIVEIDFAHVPLPW